jgi:hypothetical protein
MTRRRMVTLALATVLLHVTPLAAHNEYRIIGTVLRVAPRMLEVKQTKDGKIFAIHTDDETLVTRDKKKVSYGDIKGGGHVVVDACGDNVKDLVAMEVRLVPAPPGK